MKERTKSILNYFKNHPYLVINSFFILILLSIFGYQMLRPIDVLTDWNVETTLRGTDESLPIYYPGKTLEFISSSVKLESAEGVATRTFECDATPTAGPREISLSPVPANRAPGVNAPRENSVVVPSIVEFNGLPRQCRLVFNICYDNVVLWRDHCESARSNDFLVQVEVIDGTAIQLKIDQLEEEIRGLRGQIPTGAANGGGTQTIIPNQSTSNPTANNQQNTTNNSNNTTNNSTTNNPAVSRGLVETVVDGATDLTKDVLGGVRSLFSL